MAKKTTMIFIKEAKARWGNQNDYSNTNYLGCNIKVDIRCRKHDISFLQLPTAHLTGKSGCPKCKNEKLRLARLNSKKWRESMVNKRKYKVGLKQGRLKVLKSLSEDRFLCLCDCGSKKEISLGSLRAGTQSCGCLYNEALHERRLHRVGFKQGRLEVIEELDNNNLLCKCKCGRKKEITRESLKAGTESCGCKKWDSVWKGYQEISLDYFTRISKQKNRLAQYGKIVPFKLTIEQLWDLYNDQEKRCALTGWEIYFKTRKFAMVQRKQTASLDRIDSSGIYEIGNVQWVHKDIQNMKWDLSNDEIIKWCKRVRDNEISYNR